MKKYISSGTYLYAHTPGGEYRIKCMIDGFEYYPSTFIPRLDDDQIDRLYRGGTITSDGRKYYILLEDEYGHESDPDYFLTYDEFMDAIHEMR